jgi:catechol-2,3-dioxygenase
MSAAPVSKFGFFEVRTPEVERLADYYEQALGLAVTERSDSAVYLTTGSDHHCVVVAEGELDGRARLGFELECGLDEAADALTAAGMENRRLTNPEPGITDAIEIHEAMTGTPIVLYKQQVDSGVAEDGSRPTKLGHLAGYVPDLTAARSFYEEVLGFRWSDMVGDFFVFMRCNADHHAINLLQSDKRAGLFHVAFEARDIVHLKEILDKLAAHQVKLMWGPGRHGPGHNIFTYHEDPDGNIIELFTELDVVADERTGEFEPRPWHESVPQVPQVWQPTDDAANKWGPLFPGFIDR